MAGVLGGQLSGEPFEDLDIVAARIALAVLPQRLGIPAVLTGGQKADLGGELAAANS